MPSTDNGQTQPEAKTSTKSSGSKGILVALGVVATAVVALFIAIKAGVMPIPGQLMKVMPESMAPALTSLTGEEAKLGLMMESGRPGVCTISSKTEDAEMTYYISGDKFKIEAIDNEDGEAIISYIVNDSEYQYHWTNLDNQGTKMKMPTKQELEEMQKEAEAMAEKYQADWDFDDFSREFEEDEDEYEVNCRFQNVPASTFEVPTNIEFMEFGDMSGFGFDDEFEGQQMDWDMNNEMDFEGLDMEGLEEWAQEMQEKYGME